MTTKPITHSIFMHVKTTPEWLRLTPPERFAFADAHVRPLLAAHPAVSMRFYDAEAFSATSTDVLVWETDDLMAYQSIVEGLRETLFWGTYFDIVDIVPAIENAFAVHYDVEPL
jgi:Darcynin, domain of unknown function